MAIEGPQATFNRTVGVKLDIDEAIRILPVDDVPLQQRVPSEPTRSIKVEWLEEGLTPQTCTVVSTAQTASPWQVVVDDASAVRVGDVYHLVDAAYDRQFLVTAVDSGTDTVTVSSFAGTLDANDPVAADVWELIGQYNAEGSDPQDERSVDRTIPYNYTQIGQEQVGVTRTQQKRAMYGLDDPYGHELMKKFKELAIRFEKSMVHGYRTFSGDSTKRFMGGLLFYITSNSQSGTAAQVKDKIALLLKDSYDVGGNATTLMVSPAVKIAISDNVDASLRQVERSDTTGGFVVERLLTDVGSVNLVMNRHFPRTKGILLPQGVKRRVFDAYFHESLAKTGDSEHGQVVGEFSLEVKNELEGGVLTVTDA
jgi:hypothetical protein